MSIHKTRRLIAFAIVLVIPSFAFAQRDDADSYPANERTNSEPPRLRGGFMQQLRSVTETVLGGPVDNQSPQETQRRRPKPPQVANDYGREQYQDEAYHSQGRGENRSWAGQFLIPSYRLRDQTAATRKGARSEGSAGVAQRMHLNDSNDRLDSESERVQRPVARSAPNALNLAPTRSQNRAYPVPRSPRPSNGDEGPTNELSGVAPPSAPLEIVSNIPANIAFIDNDEPSANHTASTSNEVPYVPRKAVPKREASKSATNSNKPASVANKPDGRGNVPNTETPKTETPKTETSNNEMSVGTKPTWTASSSPQPLPTSREKLPPSFPLDGPKPTSIDPPSLPRTTDSPNNGDPNISKPVPSQGPAILTMPAPSQGPAAPLLPMVIPPRSPNPNGSVSDVAVEPPPLQPSAPMPSRVPSQFVNAPAAPQSNIQERILMEIPHTVVKLLGPGELTTGSATGYEIVVHNPDRLRLPGLVLRLVTPPGVDVIPVQRKSGEIEIDKDAEGGSQMTWTVERIDVGGTARLPLDLKANAARNFAVAIEWTVLPQEGASELAVKQADLQVALEGPIEVEKDASGVYRLRVSNPGNAIARNVKVFVSAAGQQPNQIDVGELAAGKSEVIEMDLTFEKAGRVEIIANADAVGVERRSTNIAVNVRQALLQSKLLLPSSAPHGSTLVANIEVKNVGDGVARKLESGLLIPDNTQVVNMPAGVTRQGNKLLWEVEQVPPGQLINLPIELLFASPGENELKFACASHNGASTVASAATMVEAFADLTLTVNDPPAPAPIGQPVTYELSITNRGAKDARDVQIVAQFSDGIEPRNAKGLQHRLVPGQVLFETIPTIAAGDTVKLQIVAEASISGMHRFRAEVRCEESDMRLVEEESTRFHETVGRIASPLNTSIQR